MRLAEIEKKLEAVELKREKLKAAQAEALGKKLVTCTSTFQGKGCGKKSQIKNLTFIQTHYYVRPYSCDGGDYWKAEEGQFDCPKCGHRNRLYDRPEITELKQYFGKIHDEYDR